MTANSSLRNDGRGTMLHADKHISHPLTSSPVQMSREIENHHTMEYTCRTTVEKKTDGYHSWSKTNATGRYTESND